MPGGVWRPYALLTAAVGFLQVLGTAPGHEGDDENTGLVERAVILVSGEPVPTTGLVGYDIHGPFGKPIATTRR